LRREAAAAKAPVVMWNLHKYLSCEMDGRMRAGKPKDNSTHPTIKLTLHYLDGIFLSIKELDMSFPEA